MMIKNLFMCVWCGEELQRLKLNQAKTRGCCCADTEESPNFVHMFYLIFVFIFNSVESLLL